jgi:hypothetical protein
MTKPTGYFKMWRGWAKHPALRNDNNYRYLWLYLIEQCAFNDTVIDRYGFPVEVKRGQFFTSVRKISSDVGMGEKSVRTALRSFVNHDLIGLKTDTRWTQVTLCNYDVFQDDSKKRTQDGHKRGEQKKEGKEMKIKKEREKWWEDGYKC